MLKVATRSTCCRGASHNSLSSGQCEASLRHDVEHMFDRETFIKAHTRTTLTCHAPLCRSLLHCLLLQPRALRMLMRWLHCVWPASTYRVM